MEKLIEKLLPMMQQHARIGGLPGSPGSPGSPGPPGPVGPRVG